MDTKVFLVVRADRSVRTASRQPRLRPDEVAIPITLRFSDAWGKLADEGVIIDAGEPPVVVDTEPDAKSGRRARKVKV